MYPSGRIPMAIVLFSSTLSLMENLPFISFFFLFEDVEKKVGLKSPKLHTPR